MAEFRITQTVEPQSGSIPDYWMGRLFETFHWPSDKPLDLTWKDVLMLNTLAEQWEANMHPGINPFRRLETLVCCSVSVEVVWVKERAQALADPEPGEET